MANKGMATAWADLAAGLATAESGPISFLIGGCYSMSVWNSLDIVAPPSNPTPVPTYTNDLGVLHNALVSNYIAQGFSLQQISLPNAINVACQVRPDLAATLQATTQDQYDTVVKTLANVDLSTTQGRIAYISSVINFTPQDLATLTNAFNTLDAITCPILWVEYITMLIALIFGFNLVQTDMNNLVGSLQILRASGAYWNQYQW